jgi:hypothetical protein
VCYIENQVLREFEATHCCHLHCLTMSRIFFEVLSSSDSGLDPFNITINLLNSTVFSTCYKNENYNVVNGAAQG